MFVNNDRESFVFLVLQGQANLNVQALEERLKKLEGKSDTNSVDLALQVLHRTLDKSRFDPEDAILDLESLVRVAKINNRPKAREYECVLDEVQKRAKSLHQKSLRDLLTALVCDLVKSKVLEKTNKLLKHVVPENRPTFSQSWRRYNNQLGYQGDPRDSRRRGGFSANRPSAPYPSRRPRSSCYYCGSPQHLIRECAAFQELKSAREQQKSVQ